MQEQPTTLPEVDPHIPGINPLQDADVDKDDEAEETPEKKQRISESIVEETFTESRGRDSRRTES